MNTMSILCPSNDMAPAVITGWVSMDAGGGLTSRAAAASSPCGTGIVGAGAGACCIPFKTVINWAIAV